MNTADISRRRAVLAMLGAVVAGGLTQALFWDVAPIGAVWLVFDVLLVAAMVLLFARDAADGRFRVTLAGALVAAGAIAFGAALVLHASTWALVAALPANAALLFALPFVLARGIRIGQLRDLPRAIVDGACRTPSSLVAAATLPRYALDSTGRHHARGLLRGLALGAPVAAIFIALLSADANFSHALARGLEGSGTLLHFAGLSLLSALGYLFAYQLHARDPKRALAADAAPAPRPYRSTDDAPAPSPSALSTSTRPPLVRPFTWGVVLVQVAAVFSVFAAVNAKYLFAGHALTRAHGTVTYAEYLHAGFAQLSIATALAIVAVAVGHRLLRARGAGEAAGARIPGGLWLGALETLVLALTCVALLSCLQRLRIYEDAYGYTYLRLGVGFFQLGVLGVLLITVGKALARSWRGWGCSIVGAAFALVTAASWFNADLYIARANVDRAEAWCDCVADPFAWKELDADYLANLSEDASPVLGHPFFQRHAELAGELSYAWAERARMHREGGWRSFRGRLR